ncbi:MAG: aminoglycoside phosphotransferase family protein [Pseudomonadota bacterium]
MSLAIEQNVREGVADLLGSQSIEFAQLGIGGNNRLLQVIHGSSKLVAKCYYQHGRDSIRRQTAEWEFLTHAQACGLESVPKPIGVDYKSNITLMSLLEGQKIFAHPSTQQIKRAAQFIKAINTFEYASAGQNIPDAAESGFSYQMHSDLLEMRIERLLRASQHGDVQEDFASVIRSINDAFSAWKIWVMDAGSGVERTFHHPLPRQQRIVSPSDFGFHNILLGEDEKLQFLDFEYAGWDDAAKLICDFFWQPAVPVDRKHMSDFRFTAFGWRSDYDDICKRSSLLDPLFGLRWCCIILNPFLKSWAPRQSFANPEESITTLREQRLIKAKAYLGKVNAFFK